MTASRVRAIILLSASLSLSECDAYGQKPDDEARKITVATVRSKAVTVTQQYVCQIRSHRHIEVRAPADGYITAIQIKGGQAVKPDDLLFQIEPPKGKGKPDKEIETSPFSIRAAFDGLVGRPRRQQGSFVRKGETLTTLSDNSVMWVYFNVPEGRYLEFMAESGQGKEGSDLELQLADHSKFPQAGKLAAIGAGFNRRTGTIAFRADFPNPDGLLRHGQSGTLSISRVLKDATVIPQRATFEKLARRYVYVVDKDDVAHQREVVVQNESEDLFVIKTGVAVGDRIILDGVGLVHDGETVEFKDRQPMARGGT